ncbi:MAG: polysaccharide deacetylase family protein [Bacteroidota bacterium]|nr:polysaccharide deacetylase family protein [Bacteroidota bacterium]
MVLIFCDKVTPRIEYTFRLFFETLISTDFSLTEDRTEYLNWQGPKLNYSSDIIDEGLYMKPNSLLSTDEIPQTFPEVFSWEDRQVFFQSDRNSFLPFDPFAAGFFLAARVEEYRSHPKDAHGRFEENSSFSFSHSFYDTPVVEQWAQLVVEKIKERYNSFCPPHRKFRFLLTIDIDNAYAFRHQSFLRQTGSTLKNIVQGEIHEARKRIDVLSGNQTDPYDNYNYIRTQAQKSNLDPIYFILLGDYGTYDKNLSHRNTHLVELIQSLHSHSEIGIHPSYGAAFSNLRIQKEINRLATITNGNITKSRQHYIRISLPHSYRTLIKNRISEDYSMGLTTLCGFRSGLCTPYPFFDMVKNCSTNLKIVPFQVMDSTLNKFLEYSPQQAIQEIKAKMEEVRKVGGTFIPVWHNESLGEYGRWEGWKEVFDEMLGMGVKYMES